MKYDLTISSSPHIRAGHSTASIMRDVCIALTPALLFSIWLYGFRVLTVTLVSVAACVFFEWAYRRMMKKDNTVRDGSAALTGLLLAMVSPPSVPYWVIVLGGAFAILVVKQLYGGIGKNFLNPALAGRALMMTSWASIMTAWAKPHTWLNIASNYTAEGALDGITAATPLAALKSGAIPDQGLLNAFLGNIGGSIGEASALLLLLGGVYLVARKVISARIPLCFLGTVAVLSFLFPRGNDRLGWTAWQLCSGGVMLGAIFMATDYVTSPFTNKGKVLFGCGCGLITAAIRVFGNYAEGVTFAILLMNILVPYINDLTMTKPLGGAVEK